MPGPGKASAAPVAAAASAHPSVEPTKEAPYTMPSSLTAPDKAAPATGTTPSAVAAPMPTEIVERPAPRTLARGRLEAKPSTIWLVVILGCVLLLGYALVQVRRATRAKRRALQAATVRRAR